MIANRCIAKKTWRTTGVALALLALGITVAPRPAVAQVMTPTPTTNGNNTNTNLGPIVNIVGGVAVNVEGVISQQDASKRTQVLEARRKAMQVVPGDLNQ